MSKFLIVGLGNIGDEYHNTRHNIGFKVLDTIAKEYNLKFITSRLADVAEYKFKGKTFILIKPSTYMNLSGKAVNYWLQAEKISLENLLVLTDDIALPFGSLRLKGKGIKELNGYGVGDELIHINVWTPKFLSKEESDMLEKLRTSPNFQPKPSKSDKNFFEKMKDFFN